MDGERVRHVRRRRILLVTSRPLAMIVSVYAPAAVDAAVAARACWQL
jgi:hypothetical protein